MRRGLEKIGRICREREIPAVLAIFPIFHELADYPWQSTHDRVARAAESEGLLVLDLIEAFRDQDEKSIRLGWGDYLHPNPLGHRIAADAIQEFLEQRKLLQ